MPNQLILDLVRACSIMEDKERRFTFVIATKVTKGLGLEPPKAENPGGIPKTRKLAALKQYGFLYGIPPGFSPAERFFRQRPKGVRGFTKGTNLSLPQPGFLLKTPCLYLRTF